jgi:3-hydroxy-5-methyl-1-naphthoate 3-O-methyltransferase
MSAAQPAAVTPERIMQFMWGHVPPLAIESAIANGIFDALDKEPQTLEQLAAATATSSRGLGPVLNLLVGLQFLTRDDDGRYALTDESSAFLVSGKPAFLGGMYRHVSRQLMPNFLGLRDIVKTGKPAERVESQDEGAAFFQEFVADIFPMSYAPARVLAEALPQLKSGSPVRVLDIATGSGVWGIALAQSSPNVTVTGVDWPNVLEVTKKMAARFGLADRFNYIPGNIREVEFGTGYNVATLGHILHSEGEEASHHLLKKVFDALASGGTIAIAEFLVDADRRGPVPGLIFAVNMLVNTTEGDTYSFEEISSWLTEIGFVNIRQLDSPGPSPLILADKP